MATYFGNGKNACANSLGHIMVKTIIFPWKLNIVLEQ